MMVAGGPEYPLPLVIAQLFRYAFGIPSATSGSMALAVVGIAIIGRALAFGQLLDPPSRFFLIRAISVFSAVPLISAATTFLYTCYFLLHPLLHTTSSFTPLTRQKNYPSQIHSGY